ncbi:MAG: hypothetical protein WAV18_23515, partial [Roseiarcus sp.]
MIGEVTLQDRCAISRQLPRNPIGFLYPIIVFILRRRADRVTNRVLSLGVGLSPWRIGSTPWLVRDMDKRERRDRELRITGSLIREFGYQPASWWKDAIGEAGGRVFADPAQAREYLDRFAPPPAMPLRASGALGWTANIEAEDEAERANIAAVSRHMN